MATSRGACPYVAIPVFPSRVFRHSGIYIRTDRGIKTPADLKGRVVGIPEYQVTAAVWIRGILEDEYGVKPSDLDWRSGGMEESGRHEKLKLELPAEVRMTAIAPGKTLSAMLEAGEIAVVERAGIGHQECANRLPILERLHTRGQRVGGGPPCLSGTLDT